MQLGGVVLSLLTHTSIRHLAVRMIPLAATAPSCLAEEPAHPSSLHHSTNKARYQHCHMPRPGVIHTSEQLVHRGPRVLIWRALRTQHTLMMAGNISQRAFTNT